MQRAALAAGATIVNVAFHRFVPQGVSGVVVVQESHLSIHTWPELGYAAVDFFTCGDCVPEAAHKVLMEGLSASSCELMMLNRGVALEGLTMEIKRHEVQDNSPSRPRDLVETNGREEVSS